VRLDLAIGDVRDAELAVARKLDALGARHRGDHEAVHVAATLGRLARANLEALGPHAERHGTSVDADATHRGRSGGLLAKARDTTSDLLGRRGEPGLVLLGDLRDLHLAYAEASIDWVVLGQGAQAARDAELLSAVTTCHAQTLRGMKWTVTRLKTAAPQVLVR
jgi:hypothetical protein